MSDLYPNICRLLALAPVRITVSRTPYPRHWKPRKLTRSVDPSVAAYIRHQRLELHLLQLDLAKGLGISTVTVSSWERGLSQPSRRNQKRIRDFFEKHLR